MDEATRYAEAAARAALGIQSCRCDVCKSRVKGLATMLEAAWRAGGAAAAVQLPSRG